MSIFWIVTREALEANDALAKEHGRCVVEVERLRAELGRTQAALAKEREQSDELAIRLDHANGHRDAYHEQRDRAWLEIDQLRAQLAARPGGGYHLTDKGLAAIAKPTDKEQP